jgi:hypothetical protein
MWRGGYPILYIMCTCMCKLIIRWRDGLPHRHACKLAQSFFLSFLVPEVLGHPSPSFVHTAATAKTQHRDIRCGKHVLEHICFYLVPLIPSSLHHHNPQSLNKTSNELKSHFLRISFLVPATRMNLFTGPARCGGFSLTQVVATLRLGATSGSWSPGFGHSSLE